MKTYPIEIDDTNKKYISSGDERTTELGLVLQVWQDLTMMEKKNGPLSDEDLVVRNILNNILLVEFGEQRLIPLPEYYKR